MKPHAIISTPVFFQSLCKITRQTPGLCSLFGKASLCPQNVPFQNRCIISLAGNGKAILDNLLFVYA